MPRLHYEFNTRCVNELLMDEAIQIPEHQRPEMWQVRRQEGLIDTIMSGLPMPNLTFRHEIANNNVIHWMEDGQQRYISMRKFHDNTLAWNSRYFKDLTESERLHFLSYKISILVYRNATITETIKIFDNFQNGVSLTPGQRFHARLNTKLVMYAREKLLTPGKGFNSRLTQVFGPLEHTKDTKTKKILVNAMALAGGVAHGVNFITTSYDILGPILDTPFDETIADERLDNIIRVFEVTDKAFPLTSTQKKKQWPVGYIIGYMLAHLLDDTHQVDVWTNIWVQFLTDMRNGVSSISLVHHGMPASRNWNADRWRIGYNNVISPPSNIEFTIASDDDEY